MLMSLLGCSQVSVSTLKRVFFLNYIIHSVCIRSHPFLSHHTHFPLQNHLFLRSTCFAAINEVFMLSLRIYCSLLILILSLPLLLPPPALSFHLHSLPSVPHFVLKENSPWLCGWWRYLGTVVLNPQIRWADGKDFKFEKSLSLIEFHGVLY